MLECFSCGTVLGDGIHKSFYYVMAVDGWIINQHVRNSRISSIPSQYGIHPTLAEVCASQSGAILPTSWCIPPLNQIALEIIIATIAALYSILKLTNRFKALKQFTQPLRYLTNHAATMPPSTSPISRICELVELYYFYHQCASGSSPQILPSISLFDACGL